MLRPHYREQGTRGLSGCGVKTQTTSDIPRKSRFVRGDTGIYFSDTTSKVLGILEMAGKGSREGKEVEMGQDGSVLQKKSRHKSNSESPWLLQPGNNSLLILSSFCQQQQFKQKLEEFPDGVFLWAKKQ